LLPEHLKHDKKEIIIQNLPTLCFSW